MTDGPLIVQSDKTLLLEIGHPDAPAARANIAPFAELERSPEHIHTYRITPLALWNARAAGHDAEQVVDALVRWSRFPVPQALLVAREAVRNVVTAVLRVCLFGPRPTPGATNPVLTTYYRLFAGQINPLPMIRRL